MTSADPAVVSPSSADEEALLAWILGDLAPPDPGGKVARRLIARFHGLAGLVAADAAVLRAEGLDGACVVALEQARALAEALVRIRACERPVVSSWSALTDYLRAALAHAPREQFRVLYLDKRNILMRDELRADGTVDHAPVYNAGPSRVARLGRVPAIPETEAYVAAVLDCYLALTAGRRATSVRECRDTGGGT